MDKWEKLDPIPRYEKHLMKTGVLNKKTLDDMEAEIQAEILAAVERYENESSADPLRAFDHLYEKLPAELVEQRAEFSAALEREGLATQPSPEDQPVSTLTG